MPSAERAKRRCFVIGPIAREEGVREWFCRDLIEGAFADHPEYELLYDFDYRARYPVNSYIVDFLTTADLVIADISEENDTTMYMVGFREALGAGPIVFLAAGEVRDRLRRLVQNKFIEYDPIKPVGPYRNELSLEIAAARETFTPRFGRPASPKSQAKQLAKKVNEVAEAISELRINSAAEYVEQLHAISEELGQYKSAISNDELHDITKRIISVLAQIDSVVASSRLGKLIVSGAIAALVTKSGLGAAAVFSLSIAVWEGPSFFKSAVNKYLGKGRPAKSAVPRTSSRRSSAPRGSRRRARRSGDAPDKAE